MPTLRPVFRRLVPAAVLLCAVAASLRAFPAPKQQAEEPPATAPGSPAKPQGEGNYTFGVGYVLGIHVWRDPEMTRPNVMVRPDGRISLPLVGDVQAAGLTPPALSSIITQKLKDYVNDPHVTVIVEASNSDRR